MTGREWLKQARARFEAADNADAAWDADWMLSEGLGCTRAQMRLRRDDALSQDILCRLNEWLSRRLDGEPLQYILGSTGFMGLELRCDERALIPRQDTETLVELALERIKGLKKPRVLDLCCGTGAIGLSVAHYRPDARVLLTDVSGDALSLAEENRRLLGAGNASLAQGDLFDAASGQTFDLILTNPPYLTQQDMDALQREVRLEPALALFGGADGLAFYRRIAAQCAGFLAPGGRILLEVGQGQAQQVCALFAPPMGRTDMHRDLCGIERVVEAERLK